MNKILLLMCILLSSCAVSDKEVRSDLIHITNINSFKEDSFPKSQTLHAAIFNNSIISKPSHLALYDTLLWVTEPAYVSDTLVRCYSTSDHSYVKAVCLRGEGPSELLSAATINVSADSSAYWIFDITKQVWMKKAFNDPSAPSSANSYIMNLRDSVIAGIDNPLWLNNTHFAFNSLFKYKERFYICDSSTMIKRPIYNPAFTFKKDWDASILADIFSTHMCTDESRSHIILAGRYLDLIEIYNADGKLIRMLKGPEKGFNFQFDQARSIDRSVLVKSSESKRAYLDVKVASDKIYALYSGKTKANKEHYSFSKKLYVFSMNGNSLIKYQLDQPICSFTIDVNKKRIYAISSNYELIYFQL